MYSFARRGDTRVVDEPLYAHYLRVSGADHPGREVVLEGQDNDGERVVREVILGPCDRPVLLLKMMAHHLVDLDLGFLEHTQDLFLIRHPAEVLSSLVNQIPQPSPADTGMATQRRMFDKLAAAGQSPVVVDWRELLLDPPGVLAQLCERLDLEYTDDMLSWPEGGREEDGVWAPFWYHNIHRSTGFLPYKPKTEPFPERLQPLLEECRPHYDRLFAHALRARI